MKNIFVSLLALLILDSCKKGFLDLEPVSNVPASSFYKTAEDMQLALNSAYASLQDAGQYGIANWQVGEVRSDNTFNWDGAGNFPDAELDQFKENPSNSIINSMWLDTYHGILLCNIVIGRITAVNMNETLKKQYTAEALFLRSLMYFNLVRTFGEVPLVLIETASAHEGYAQAREPVNKIYDQIISDLITATKDLGDVYSGIDIGRVTQGAAKSLLGKVFLTRGDYSSCAAVLEEVINSGTYRLLTDYADLWNPANANNAESIFEVQYKKGGTDAGSSYNNFFAPWGSEAFVTNTGFAYGRNLPTKNLVAAYEQGDKRKKASLAESYRRGSQDIYEAYTIKYRDIPVTERDADNNWVVLRYADVLLMYAEARNELVSGPDNKAYTTVNMVRQRAGLGPLTDGLDKSVFALAIAHERQVELAFEGHRWFDLLRTQRALTMMNTHFAGAITIQPYQLLFPIPQSQVNINPDVIFQNEGY